MNTFWSRLRLSRFNQPLQHGWQDWLTQDAPILVYVVKYLLATALALWLALTLEIEQPATALLTVVIVMHFRSGMVLTKSYYRMLGTLVGIGFSVWLVAISAQERLPFLSVMTLWIALCTAGSLVFRNFQSYGFVLAGYTLCIVGIPATLTPELTFQIATTRLSEIMVGLFSATLVSELVWPQRLWENMLTMLNRRFSDFGSLLQQPASAPPSQAFQLFMQDIYQLESFRASARFETDAARHHDDSLNLLNVQFMQLSTSYIVLQRLLRRLQEAQHPASPFLQTQFQALAAALLVNGQPAAQRADAVRICQQIAHYQQPLEAWQPETLPRMTSHEAQLDLETGHALLKRLTQELLAYVSGYAALDHTQPAQPSTWTPREFALHIDPWSVLMAAMRGGLTLLLLASLWIAIDWPSGIIAMTLGTITSTLFAGSPKPLQTVKSFALGVGLGILVVFWLNFHLLTVANDAITLFLALSPIIALIAWLSARPATTLVGAGLGIGCLLMVGFNQSLNANPVRYFNDAIALGVALLVSAALFSLTDLTGNQWLHGRLWRQLRRLVIDACQLKQPLDALSFEMRARDLIYRASQLHPQASPQHQRLFEALFTTLEIGHAVYGMRAAIQALPASQQRPFMHVLKLLARHYRQPSIPHQRALLRWLEHSIRQTALEDAFAAHASDAELRLHLHLIRSVIQSETLATTLKEPTHAS